MKLTSLIWAGAQLGLGCGLVFAQNEISPAEENLPSSGESAPGLYTTILPDGLLTTRVDDRPNGVLGMGTTPSGAASGIERRASTWRPSETGNAWYFGTTMQNGAGQPSTLGRAVVLKTNSITTQTLINTQTNVPTGRYGTGTATLQPGVAGEPAAGTGAK